MVFDVAVIGAGISGLTCAQQLHASGYKVVVIEKSRGVGGRVATRRLYETFADHGACYLNPQEEELQKLVKILCDRHLLQVWTDTVYELDTTLHPQSSVPRYVAPSGMNAIAKFLAQGLEIHLNHRVEQITPTNQTWQLTTETATFEAKAIVAAIPAPQALMLVEPLAESNFPATFLDSLRSVEFYPCLSVMAGYSADRQQELEQRNPNWKACSLSDSDLAWIGLDSSKRLAPEFPVFVLHSTAEYATRHLDAPDLQPAAQQMLNRAADCLMPWLSAPNWFQIHRWRYAFPSRPLNQDYLAISTPLPLVCCGDWCWGNLIDGALQSGLAAATQINTQLQQLPLSTESFLAGM